MSDIGDSDVPNVEDIHASITIERVTAAVEAGQVGLENMGFCTACGAEAHGVEPDARGYTCEACEEDAVWGAEELAIIMAEA